MDGSTSPRRPKSSKMRCGSRLPTTSTVSISRNSKASPAISIVSAGPLGNPADNLAGCAYEPNQPRQTGSVTGWILPLVPIYLNLSATTPVYLNGQAAWTGAGGMQLYGKITAQGNPSGAVSAYPNFLLVHSSIDARVGYINLNDIQWIKQDGTGSQIQVGDQVFSCTETATYIASGGTQP